jgi:AraC-like DNA-binding protein
MPAKSALSGRSNAFNAVKPHVAPVLAALRQIDERLEREQQLSVLVAAPCEAELKRVGWPAHNEVFPSKPLQRRVARVSRSSQVTKSAYQVLGQATLCFVLSGRAILRYTDYALSCRAGDCIFIPEGVPHAIGSHVSPQNPKEQCELLWLRPHPPGQWFHVWICHSHGLLHESGPQRGTCRVENAAIHRQFQNLSEELQDENEPRVVHRFVLGLLLLLQREMEKGQAYMPGHHLADHHVPHHANLQDPMELACDFIDEHLGQSLVEGRVARYLCISPTLFRQRFRKHTGKTFHDFLTSRRLQKANALLHETDITIADISRLVGLQYSQFRRLYYHHYSCSPGEFRKQAKLNKNDE